MESRNIIKTGDLIIGQGKPFLGYCHICGRPLLLDGGCAVYHKVKNQKRKKFSGKSKSEHAGGFY